MTIGTPTFATPVLVSTAATATTASITPAGSDVIIAAICWMGQNSAAPSMTMSNGAGFGTLATAWTQMARIGLGLDTVPGYYAVTEYWACKVGASPSGATVTATRGGSTTEASFWLHVCNVSGADVPGTPNNATTHTNTSPYTLALTSAPASTSAVFGAVGYAGSTTIGPPTGFTEAAESTDATFGSEYEDAYKIGSVSQSNQWTGGNPVFGVYCAAFELPQAAGGGGTKALPFRARTITRALMRRMP